MTKPRTDHRYALPARALHWIVAAAIPVQVYLGHAAEREADRDASFRLIQQHYQLGVAIFALMLLRILWRVGHGTPPRPRGEPRWRRLVAVTVHWLLYALILTLPVSGYVMWVWMDAPMDVAGLGELPRLFTPPAGEETGRALAWYIHTFSAWLVVALVAVHVGAALWHQFVQRDQAITSRIL